MKKFFLSCFILSFFQISAFSQSCLPEGITFETQAQIDSFQVDFPGCTTIEGSVYFTNTDISDMGGLSVLDSILGSLIFEDAELLVDMTGLNNLRFIGGDLLIYYNPGLTSLTGLENLQSIGGNLEIEVNFALSSLAGLENISAASIHDINIYDNPNLSDCYIQGICDYLSAPNGQVNIHDNATGCNNPHEIADHCGVILPCLSFGNYYFLSQADIDSFPSYYPDCDQLKGYISIRGEDITHLDSLSGIDTINGSLSLCGNVNLPNLNGLNNIRTIQGNLNIGEMECIGNNELTNLEGLNNLVSIDGGMNIIGNDGLLTLSGLDTLSEIGGGLTVMWNKSLKNLHGLDHLNSADYIYIFENNSLLNLNGLQSLINVNNDITIKGNPSLFSISGIANIDADLISGLSISDNNILSDCDVQSICDYLADPGGSVGIQDNAAGCNSREEVELACGVGVGEVGSRQLAVVIYPNPFSYQTTFNIRLENSARVYLKMFNSLGQVVATILDDQMNKGQHQVIWDSEGLAPGIYFYCISMYGQPLTGKLVVVK